MNNTTIMNNSNIAKMITLLQPLNTPGVDIEFRHHECSIDVGHRINGQNHLVVLHLTSDSNSIAVYFLKRMWVLNTLHSINTCLDEIYEIINNTNQLTHTLLTKLYMESDQSMTQLEWLATNVVRSPNEYRVNVNLHKKGTDCRLIIKERDGILVSLHLLNFSYICDDSTDASKYIDWLNEKVEQLLQIKGFHKTLISIDDLFDEFWACIIPLCVGVHNEGSCRFDLGIQKNNDIHEVLVQKNCDSFLQVTLMDRGWNIGTIDRVHAVVSEIIDIQTDNYNNRRCTMNSLVTKLNSIGADGDSIITLQTPGNEYMFQVVRDMNVMCNIVGTHDLTSHSGIVELRADCKTCGFRYRSLDKLAEIITNFYQSTKEYHLSALCHPYPSPPQPNQISIDYDLEQLIVTELGCDKRVSITLDNLTLDEVSAITKLLGK